MQAVKNALGSVFFNKGENCIAAGRLFVEETIYDEFIEKYVFADYDAGYMLILDQFALCLCLCQEDL